jgi:hypothetical protein
LEAANQAKARKAGTSGGARKPPLQRSDGPTEGKRRPAATQRSRPAATQGSRPAGTQGKRPTGTQGKRPVSTQQRRKPPTR